MNTKNQKIIEKKKLYKVILKSLAPLVKKYGKNDVRLALNYWNNIEREKNRLTKIINQTRDELGELDNL